MNSIFNNLICISLKKNTELSNIYIIKKHTIFILFIYILLVIIYIYYYHNNNNPNYNNYIHKHIFNIKKENNSFIYYYFNYSGDFKGLYKFMNNLNYTHLNKSNSLMDIERIGKNIDIEILFLQVAKTKIENIFILLAIFPFLKEDSIICYKNKNKEDYKIMNKIFYKTDDKRNVKIFYNDLKNFINKFNESINYDWEIIKENELIKTIRYIINNYYNETFLEIFDKSMNMIFKRYIQNIRNNLSINEINEMMSKFLII